MLEKDGYQENLVSQPNHSVETSGTECQIDLIWGSGNIVKIGRELCNVTLRNSFQDVIWSAAVRVGRVI